ncbi:MAG: hypothetical protein M1546_08265 [Chloroflexi bacterium]|nr:hypothetical protein [Chloroflexota bacterium]
MRRYDMRLLWGLLLIAGGALFLLENLGILPLGGYVWALLFAVGGLTFLGVFSADRANWWAVIPGLTLLGIGMTIALSIAFPEQVGAWIGAGFLGMIGLAFWIVYLTNREFWWAIIPGGVLVTLAMVAGIAPFWGGFETGGLFFLGMGLTFALVGVVPTPQGRMTWAFIPASILTLMGLLVMAAATSLINYIWPIVLIAFGVVLLWRAFVYKRS